jgi:hypothetical protein
MSSLARAAFSGAQSASQANMPYQPLLFLPCCYYDVRPPLARCLSQVLCALETVQPPPIWRRLHDGDTDPRQCRAGDQIVT